jgi:hypothetical protein
MSVDAAKVLADAQNLTLEDQKKLATETLKTINAKNTAAAQDAIRA